jgi:hypothetical protein
MATLLGSLHEMNLLELFPPLTSCASDLDFSATMQRSFLNKDTAELRTFSGQFNNTIKSNGLEGVVKRAFNFSITEIESFLKTVRNAKYLRVYNGIDNFGNHVSFCSLIKDDNTVVVSEGTFLLSDLPCPPRPHCPDDPILSE